MYRVLNYCAENFHDFVDNITYRAAFHQYMIAFKGDQAKANAFAEQTVI
jgi:hypothetical protein